MSMMHVSIGDKRNQHTPKIIKAGYIFDKNFYGRFQTDVDAGLKERQNLMESIEECISTDIGENCILDQEVIKRGNNLTLTIDLIDQTIMIHFDTINSIVNQNQDRKINQKSYLPFDKMMDKYNSVYVSVETSNLTEDSYDVTVRLLSRIMNNMNLYRTNYAYKSMILKSPLVA